jgi:peptidoglycan/LPS O-acetylase OafA/YrhL
MVLGAHCHYAANFPARLAPIFGLVFDGDFGVRCFFVISGFLITWLMMAESRHTGEINLRHFYARRALRIFPVYFTFIGVLGLLCIFTPFDQSRAAWLANLTFTTNFVQSSWPSGHLWSLAVEEQFYLVWPFLFAVIGLHKNPQNALRVLALPMVLAPIWRVVSYKEFYPPRFAVLFTHFSFFNYFDSLAMGCACAVLLGSFRKELEKYLQSSPKRTAMLGLTMVLLPYFLQLLHLPGRVYAASNHSFQSFGFALLMLQSVVLPDSGLYPLLNGKFVRHLGVLSFSLYIWQQIFCAKPAIFGADQHWWITFPLWLVPVLIIAHISYYGVEQPFLRLRSRFR